MLYTADQYYYGPTTRFRAGCEELDKNEEVERQKQNGVNFSYNYAEDGVKYLSNTISKEWYDAHIDEPVYVPYSSFEGISIEKANEWKPGNVIIFDNARIHFAQKIKTVGATYKLGISLNYATL
jgi:predicted phosphatase